MFMQKVFDYLLNNWEWISPIVYELLVRLFPTKKNLSFIDGAFFVVGKLIPNKSTEKTSVIREGQLNNTLTNNHVVKMIVVFVLLTSSLFGQTNSTFKAARSYHADSLTVKNEVLGLQLMYGDVGALYYNNQSSKWEVFQDSVWYDLLGSAGGGNNYTGTSPTTITVGGLNSGSSIAGLTYTQILQSILVPYINPAFTSFTNNQTSPVEVGTTLSGSKTFTWGISLGSGTVATIDIYDNTASSTLLAGTPNDGSQPVTITTKQLLTNGSTQSWKGIGNNSTPIGTFNSSNKVITANYFRWYAPVSSVPTNSATVRAVSVSAFQTSNVSTFILNTGSTLIDFFVDLPTGVTITEVLDLDALNANITANYVLQTAINVNDAGGTPYSTNPYAMHIAIPYSVNHRHQITTN